MSSLSRGLSVDLFKINENKRFKPGISLIRNLKKIENRTDKVDFYMLKYFNFEIMPKKKMNSKKFPLHGCELLVILPEGYSRRIFSFKKSFSALIHMGFISCISCSCTITIGWTFCRSLL
jgi:hypothetical protein